MVQPISTVFSPLLHPASHPDRGGGVQGAQAWARAWAWGPVVVAVVTMGGCLVFWAQRTSENGWMMCASCSRLGPVSCSPPPSPCRFDLQNQSQVTMQVQRVALSMCQRW